MELKSALGSAAEAAKFMLKGVTDEMQMCIMNCLQCHQVCERMIQHCLTKGGAHAAPDHIKTLRDCADICALSADFMLRSSDLHMRTCQVCAEACTKCATECENMNDDEMMQMCIDVCKRCAETCSKMAVQQ